MPSKSRRSIKPNFLFQYSIKEIHQAILKYAENKVDLAHHLNTSDTMTLPTHLGKFLLNGRPLTIERLKQLSVEEAALHMGKYYDTVLPERQPHVTRYSPTYLHQICSSVDTIRSAAVLLGIRDHTLSRHLSAVTHKVHGKTIHLTFDTFRSLSPEEVLVCFAHQKPKHHSSFHALPHERFNLTPDIPEDLSGLIRIDTHEVSQPESTIAWARKKRPRPSVSATEDYILTALSMFTQTSLNRETLSEYHLRPRKKRAEEPDFLYSRLSSDSECGTSTPPDTFPPASGEDPNDMLLDIDFSDLDMDLLDFDNSYITPPISMTGNSI